MTLTSKADPRAHATVEGREWQGRPRVAAKRWEAADLIRIPFWLLARPVYSLAPISFHFRIAALRGTVDSLRSPLRSSVREAIEQYLGPTKGEQQVIARHHFQFLKKGQFTRLWPQVKGFAGAERIEVDGLHHLDEALATGRGAILVTAHFGYARMIKPILRSRGREVLLVGPQGANLSDLPPFFTRLGALVHTRLLRLPRASRFDERWQRTVGEDLPTVLNLRPHLAALERNQTLVILTDGRSAAALSKLPVLGIDVHFAPGALSLARATGAAALPTFVVDEQGGTHGGLRLVIHPPLDLQATTNANADLALNLRRFATVYEEQVRKHPHNWHWTWIRDGVFDNPQNHSRGGAKTAAIRRG